MITVNLQSGGTYSIEENIVANIKSNSGGSEIVVVEAEQLRSIFSSQSPATVAGLSPYFLSLTNIQRAEVVATIGYSGLSNTIDFVFNIGAGRWSKITDNGTNSLTAVAQLVQNITVGQAITSDTGFAKVSSVSYTYPSNTIYLNALRIKDVTALGFYGGSLVKYDEGGTDFAEYEVGIAPATLVTQINATGGGGSGWSLTGNAGTDYTVNYIGTTDNEPLTFRTNGVARLGFDGTGGALSTTDVFNQAGSYSILQWTTNSINQKIYVLDVNAASVEVTPGSVVTLTEDTGTGIFNQTIVSLAEILLSASGTGTADIHVYPSGEIAILASDNLLINGSGGGNVGINATTPSQKLDVGGNIQLSGALITVPQYETPLTGTTVTSDGSQQLVINPLGTLLALTVAFPATPVDGQKFDISCTQIITGLTLTSAATILGTLTTFAAANAFAGWVYSATATSWVRQH